MSVNNSLSSVFNLAGFLELIGVSNPGRELISVIKQYIQESGKNYEQWFGQLQKDFELHRKDLAEQNMLENLLDLLNRFKSPKLLREIYFVTGRAAAGKSYLSNKLSALIKQTEVLHGDGYLLPSRKERVLYEDEPFKKFHFSLFESHIRRLAFTDRPVPKLKYRDWDGEIIREGYLGKNLNSNIIVDSVFFGNLDQYQKLSSMSTASIFVAIEDVASLFNRIWRDLKFRNAASDDVTKIIQNDYLRLQKQHIPISWRYLEKSDVVLQCNILDVKRNGYPFHYSYSLYKRNRVINSTAISSE